MKRTTTVLGNWILILATVSCTVFALVSAFGFELDARLLFVAFALMSLTLSILLVYLPEKVMWIPFALVFAFFLWKLPEILEGGKLAVFLITREYNKWLYVPVFFSGATGDAASMTLFLLAFGILLTFALAQTIGIYRSSFLTVFFTLPFVLLTVILTETVPDFRYLIGLLAVYLSLLVSSLIHPEDFLSRGSGIFYAIALSIGILGIVYLITPPEKYSRSVGAREIDSRLRSTVANMGLLINKTGRGWPFNIMGVWRFDTERVEISDAGARAITDQGLLEISSTLSGTFYLRGFSMQTFNGREWRTNRATLEIAGEEHSVSMPATIAMLYLDLHGENAAVSSGYITIAPTGDSSNIIYRPYYSTDRYAVGALPNYSMLREKSGSYAISFYDAREGIVQIYKSLSPSYLDNHFRETDNQSAKDILSAYGEALAGSRYTEVAETTAIGLRAIAADAGIDPDAPREVVAAMVADLISSSARYTLSPYIIPDDEDFALYFLQTSKLGYCIHFATAATLMLRSLGVPARFTSGYVVTVSEKDVGGIVTVTDRNAHAWVEVYYEDLGWLPLEVTPPSVGTGIVGGLPFLVTLPTFELPDWEIGPYDDQVPQEGSNSDGQKETATVTQTLDMEETSDEQVQVDSQETSQVQSNGWIIGWIVFAAVFPFAFLVYRKLLLRSRSKRFSQRDANSAVLYVWRFVSSLSREDPPRELEEIALKARFSQHRISETERTVMIEKSAAFARELYDRRKKPMQLWMKYVRGV